MLILPELARTEECSDEEGSGHWRIYFLVTEVERKKMNISITGLQFELFHHSFNLHRDDSKLFPLKNELHLCLASEGTHGLLMSDKRLLSHPQTGQDLAQ